jgi:hypothetical protein
MDSSKSTRDRIVTWLLRNRQSTSKGKLKTCIACGEMKHLNLNIYRTLLLYKKEVKITSSYQDQISLSSIRKLRSYQIIT